MSGFVPPNPRPLIAAAIAAHDAQSNPHPVYLSHWVSGTEYMTGTVAHSLTDYRAYRASVDFVSGGGDLHWDNVVLLLDVQNGAPVNISPFPAGITTSGELNYPNLTAHGRKLIAIGQSGTIGFNGDMVGIGGSDFCIEIFVNQYASSQALPTVLSSNDGSDSRGYFEIGINRSSLVISVRYGGAKLFAFDSVDGDIYYKLSRKNGFITLHVNGVFIDSDWFGLDLQSAEIARFGMGISGNFGLRITGHARDNENEIPEIWANSTAIGPSVVDPADDGRWQLVYNPADTVPAAVAAAVAAAVPAAVAAAVPAAVAVAVAAAVPDAVAAAVPGAVAAAVPTAVEAEVADALEIMLAPSATFCTAVAAANIINSGPQGGG